MHFKDFFSVPNSPYFLSHSVGCLPKCTRSALTEHYLDPWKNAGGEAWGTWLGAIDKFSEQVSLLINAQAKDVCPQSNLSSGFSKFLMSLPVAKKANKVLMAQTAFPSMGYVAMALERVGLELVLIEQSADETELEAWQRYLDDNVLCALITHVHSNTGRVSDIPEISQLCAKRGVYVTVDIAQSVGILPIDIQNWHAHAVFGSCVKWLCGGPGAGFMWVNPKLVDELQPVDVGWFSHQAPFEMNIREFRYADSAKRFWGGTPSVAPFVMAASAINQIRDIGVTNILHHNRGLMGKVLAKLANTLEEPVVTQNIGGTLCLNLPDKEFGQLCRKLDEACGFYDTRGNTIRLSFHIFNSEQDIAIFD